MYRYTCALSLLSIVLLHTLILLYHYYCNYYHRYFLLLLFFTYYILFIHCVTRLNLYNLSDGEAS